MRQENIQEEAQFEIQDLLGAGMTIVVLVIGLAYGINITADIGEDMCDGTTEHYSGGECWNCNSSSNSFNASGPTCSETGNESIGKLTAVEGGSASFNATEDGIDAIAKIPAKLGMVVTVIMASVIIGLLVRYLWAKFA